MKQKLELIFNSQGISLIEILIAVTIFAFITLAVNNVTNSSLEKQSRILKDDRIRGNVEAAINRMQLDIFHLYSPLFFSRPFDKKSNDDATNELLQSYEGNENFIFPNSKGIPVPAIKSPETYQLQFLSTINRRKMENNKTSNFTWIRYTVEPSDTTDKDGNPLNRLIRKANAFNPYNSTSDIFENTKGFILHNSIKSLNFLFWDEKEEEFIESLKSVGHEMSEKLNGENLLRAIKVELIWVDPDGFEHVEERIFRVLWPYFDPYSDLNKSDEKK